MRVCTGNVRVRRQGKSEDSGRSEGYRDAGEGGFFLKWHLDTVCFMLGTVLFAHTCVLSNQHTCLVSWISSISGCLMRKLGIEEAVMCLQVIFLVRDGASVRNPEGWHF